MKKSYSPEMFFEQSFTEFNITFMHIDVELRLIRLKMEGAYIRNDLGEIDILNVLDIIISHWQNLNVTLYDSEKNEYINLDNYSDKVLRNVCEFVCEGDYIILKGFANDHSGWMEWKFDKPEIAFEY